MIADIEETWIRKDLSQPENSRCGEGGGEEDY